MKKVTVSLCMIVKNEEKYLEKCLNSVRDLVDEIVIVDTGSTDKTVEIAKKFNSKIYITKWNNNFSEARNISLKKATKDWILIMDADDIFEEEDKGKFIELINKGTLDGYYFNTISYVLDNNKNDYIYNANIRLIRNTKNYEFVGAIHEQLSHKFNNIDYSNFGLEDIRIHHTGYLPTVVKEKNKRERNIPIIKEELLKNPESPFHNFNLANEYLALGNINEGLKYYNKAYEKMDINTGYANKLIIKRISAYIELKKYEIALKEINDALKLLPKSTNLHFYKGYIYQKQRRYTLAIKSFNKCIELGEEKEDFQFVNGCGSFRSYFALGDIYLSLKDYEEAIINYEKSIESHNQNILVFFKLGTAYYREYNDKEKVINKISRYFNLDKVEDLIILSSVLNYCLIYDYSLYLLNKALSIEKSDRVIKEIGKNYIYLGQYNKAIEIFEKVPINSISYDEVICNNIIAKILADKTVLTSEINQIKNQHKRKAILGIYLVNSFGEAPMIVEDANEVLGETIILLETILKAKEVFIFEKVLNTLNYIKSDKVLLELAKLYNLNNYLELAKEESLRSIKNFESIDRELAEILYFSII